MRETARIEAPFREPPGGARRQGDGQPASFPGDIPPAPRRQWRGGLPVIGEERVFFPTWIIMRGEDQSGWYREAHLFVLEMAGAFYFVVCHDTTVKLEVIPMNIKSANELRSLFLRFFEEKGHARIPSASVIPENDPTVLFTTAGMHPLVPYLMGEKHPMGNRLTDVQKCIRTGDIDEVGDASHLTFFEMLGNWSLGDYFKEQMIPWSWEFLTSPDWLGLDPDKLAFTVFEGDEDAPRDEEAAGLWRAQGVKDENLFYLPKKHNWWGPAGITGPCGPDSEMFIIRDQPPCGPDCSPACSCGRYLEIWNDVFMQYEKLADGTFIPLKQKNVDTGMGLERTYCVLMGVDTVYETEIFSGIIGKIEELSGKKYGQDEETTKSIRIISDHMRTATFIIGDDRGVTPSNVDQGYVLRRLIRRAVRHGMKLGMPAGFTCEIAQVIIDQYKDVYPELERNGKFILDQLKMEEDRFQRTLKKGQAEFEKVYGNMMKKRDAFAALKANKADPDAVAAALRQLPPSPENKPVIEQVKDGSIADETIDALLKATGKMDGRSAFKLYDTYGFPIEITCEMAAEKGIDVDVDGFQERFKKHQENSHAGAEQRFKGGLGGPQRADREAAHRHPPAARRPQEGPRPRGRPEGLQHHRRAPAL